MTKISVIKSTTWVVFAMVMSFARLQPASANPPINHQTFAQKLVSKSGPDWRDQIIYFVLTDRFSDGDPSNNNQGAGEFNQSNTEFYQGGDFKGLTQKLAYIQGLGATALWVTPPVANQWFNPTASSASYHGYWASNFSKLDPHLGSLADYKQLADSLHQRNMLLIQDIVLNHTGDYFSIKSDSSKTITHTGAGPDQYPFSLNDARRVQDKKIAAYHWSSDIKNYSNRREQLTGQMSGLDDINTENPLVRKTLKQSYADWISNVGVDGFRIDTAVFVPTHFLNDFLYSNDPQAPGVLRAAHATGKPNFFVFGEIFSLDAAFKTKAAKQIEQYANQANNKPLMTGMLNFPLYGSLLDVFARGQAPAVLAHRITAMQQVHKRVHWMPSFLDNHDVDRISSVAGAKSIEQGLLTLFTLPGIPTIYYGTEQGFTQPRASMFAQGYGSAGKDHFDTTSAQYQLIARLAAMRKSNPIFSRGTAKILYANSTSSGALVYEMRYGTQRAIVAINTADSASLADNLALGLQTNQTLKPLLSLQASDQSINEVQLTTPSIQANTKTTWVLPARAALVWLVDNQLAHANLNASSHKKSTTTPATKLKIDSIKIDAKEGSIVANGNGEKNQTLKLVLDGAWNRASVVKADSNGQWQSTVAVPGTFTNNIERRLILVAESEQANQSDATIASPPFVFTLNPKWQLMAKHADPALDDKGPSGATGSYTYPTDIGWGDRHQMDLRDVRIYGAGGALKIELTMASITNGWNPPNGFDRTAFTVFIQMPRAAIGPDQPSSQAMPFQQSQLPNKMQWHYRLRVGGWSNALFNAKGANEQNEGTVITPGAQVLVDKAKKRITLSLSNQALGYANTLEGAKVYITTWDHDGSYRKLEKTAGQYQMGGAQTEHDPLMMDDTPVLELTTN
jgi:glycosidase